jgi:hypothetical protein
MVELERLDSSPSERQGALFSFDINQLERLSWAQLSD